MLDCYLSVVIGVHMYPFFLRKYDVYVSLHIKYVMISLIRASVETVVDGCKSNYMTFFPSPDD